MKKFGFLALALGLSVSALATPSLTSTNTSPVSFQQQPPALPEDAAAAYADYYNEKDQAKRYEKAKSFLEKFASVDEYWKKGPQGFIQRYELGGIYSKCQEADKAFFGAPNEANLNTFLAACDVWVAKAPTPDPFYSTRMALGTGYGVLAAFYKDTDRGFKYTEKSLELLNPTTAPKEWKQADWDSFRKDNIGRLIQYQGLYKLRQATPDFPAAADYLTKAAAVKDGPALKDPNTYLLRAEAITDEYTKLNNEYNALSNDDKIGDKGKAILEKINPVVSRLTNDYARVVVLTEGNAPYKAIYDSAKESAEAFYKFLKNGKLDGLNDIYTRFKTDISASDLEIQAEASATPPKTPVGGKGTKATAAAGAGGAAPAGATAEKTTTKPAATKAPVRKKR